MVGRGRRRSDPTPVALDRGLHRSVAAVERHGVASNMGINQRWEMPYDTIKALVHGGRYGRLLSMTIHQRAGLFNMGSHAFEVEAVCEQAAISSLAGTASSCCSCCARPAG